MSFRNSAAPGSRRDADDDDEITRLRKAAAWVWHTRAVGDSLVVPTKRVTPAANSSYHRNINTAASSRFRAEARTSARIHDVVHDHPSLDLGGTRLYDEFELAGLKSYMAEFVQRLQRQENQERAASNDHDRLNQPRTKEEIKPLKRSGSLSSVLSSRRLQRQENQERAASNDHDRLNQSRTNEEIKPLRRSGSLSSVMSSRRLQRQENQERAASNDHDRLNQPRTNEEIRPLKRSGSLSSVMSSRRLSSSIHKLFRKISAAFKSSDSPPMRADNQGLGAQRNDRYPFHHYIQHHHHHYHYDWRQKESFDNMLIRSRSHSESYRSQQHTSSSGEEGSADDNEPGKAFPGDIFTIKVGRTHAEVPDLQLEKQTDCPRHRRRHSEYFKEGKI